MGKEDGNKLSRRHFLALAALGGLEAVNFAQDPWSYIKGICRKELPGEIAIDKAALKGESMMIPEREWLRGEVKSEVKSYRPPEGIRYLEGYPFIAGDMWTRGLLTDGGGGMYFFSIDRGKLCFSPVENPDPEGNSSIPFPELNKGEIYFIPVLGTPSCLGEEGMVVMRSLLIDSQGNLPIMYTVGDLKRGEILRTIRATQICASAPAVITAKDWGGDSSLIVAVGSQANADWKGAGIEFIDSGSGRTEMVAFEGKRCLPDGVKFAIGRVSSRLGRIQIGMTLSDGVYRVYDRQGGCLEVARGIEKAIWVDMNDSGVQSVVGSKDGGRVVVIDVDKSKSKEWMFGQKGDTDSSWRVTGLSAFRLGDRSCVLATAATDFFKETRTMVIQTDKHGDLVSYILKDDKGRDLPMGYGLVGVSSGNKVALAAAGYEKSDDRRNLQRILITLNFNAEEQGVSWLKEYSFGTFGEGVTSVDYPAAGRLSRGWGVVAPLNLHSQSGTWIVGVPLANFHGSELNSNWSQDGGDWYHTNSVQW